MRKTMMGLALGWALGMGGAALAQDTSMTEVADGVYHFWNSGYSSLVVVGDDGVLVTDPAFTPRAAAMNEEIAKVTDLPVKYVVLSHEHFDHVGGSEVFANAEIVCHQTCSEVFSVSPLMPVPEIDVTFGASLTLDVGGKAVDLHHIAPGDGIATVVAHVPGADVVFSVDMYEPRSFTISEFKEDTNFVGVLKTLNAMLEWQPVYAINGHSPGNSVEALAENAEMYGKLHDEVLRRLQAALAEGGPPAAFPLLFSMPNDLRMDEYTDWNAYDTAFPGYVRRMLLSIFHGG